jgi:hypothetical protein
LKNITELPPTIPGPTAANCRAVRMAGEEMAWSKWHFPPKKITFVFKTHYHAMDIVIGPIRDRSSTFSTTKKPDL